MASGGRLARVDVTDHDNVDMGLFLSHLGSSKNRYDKLLKEQNGSINCFNRRFLQSMNREHIRSSCGAAR